MRNKLIKKTALGLVVLLLVGTLCACRDTGEQGKVIFTTGFASDELFRIGDISCTMPEYMLLLTNMQNEYEGVFGEQIWDVTFEDTTLEDNVKDIVLAQIAQMKSIYLLAKEKEIVLTEEEENNIGLAAENYFSSLSESEAGTLGVSQEVVEQLYREYTMARKVYQQIIAQVNPEISDDEARTVTVEQILIKTHTTDGAGNIIEYSESMKADALKKIQEIHELAINGENDFTQLAAKYSEDDVIHYSIRKGEVKTAVEEVVFNLQTDEISDVVESEDGYHILKCITTLDREETDANKLVLIEKRKNEAFSKEYDTFVGTLARKLNDKLWQQVELIPASEVSTNSFFDVYEEYLGLE